MAKLYVEDLLFLFFSLLHDFVFTVMNSDSTNPFTAGVYNFQGTIIAYQTLCWSISYCFHGIPMLPWQLRLDQWAGPMRHLELAHVGLYTMASILTAVICLATLTFTTPSIQFPIINQY